jgi:hypothetical protein
MIGLYPDRISISINGKLVSEKVHRAVIDNNPRLE